MLAQICAASGDPQQIIDADNWRKQNPGPQGQALTDAAQMQGFDPAFISLVNFPAVLDMMAAHVDDYAALGAAFKANQASVMSAIQAFRQQAYASGALDSNEYQTVSVEQQNGAQVVIVQPANPQIVYVPQYQPARVYVAGPSADDVVAASLISFGAGIAIGALITDSRPWGWGGWGWGWGGGGLVYRQSPWGFITAIEVRVPTTARGRPFMAARSMCGRRRIGITGQAIVRRRRDFDLMVRIGLGRRDMAAVHVRPAMAADPRRPEISAAADRDMAAVRVRPAMAADPRRPEISAAAVREVAAVHAHPGNGGRPTPPGDIGGGRPGSGGGARPPGNGGRPTAPGDIGGGRPGSGGGARPPGNGGRPTAPGDIGGGRPGSGGGSRPPGNGG